MVAQAKLMEERFTRPELVVLHRYRGIFERRYAEQKHDSGTAVSSADAERLFSLLEKGGHPRVACALYIMGLTGLRLVDVRRLRMCDVLFKEGHSQLEIGPSLRVKVRYGKTIKKTSKALPVESKLDRCLIQAPAAFRHFQSVVSDCVRKKEIDAEFFTGLETSTVGAILRDLRPEGMEVTTRCFRKHFAARAYAESGGNPTEASRRLGHSNPRMGGAFYLGLDGDHVVEEYVQAFKYNIQG